MIISMNTAMNPNAGVAAPTKPATPSTIPGQPSTRPVIPNGVPNVVPFKRPSKPSPQSPPNTPVPELPPAVTPDRRIKPPTPPPTPAPPNLNPGNKPTPSRSLPNPSRTTFPRTGNPRLPRISSPSPKSGGGSLLPGLLGDGIREMFKTPEEREIDEARRRNNIYPDDIERSRLPRPRRANRGLGDLNLRNSESDQQINDNLQWTSGCLGWEIITFQGLIRQDCRETNTEEIPESDLAQRISYLTSEDASKNLFTLKAVGMEAMTTAGRGSAGSPPNETARADLGLPWDTRTYKKLNYLYDDYVNNDFLSWLPLLGNPDFGFYNPQATSYLGASPDEGGVGSPSYRGFSDITIDNTVLSRVEPGFPPGSPDRRFYNLTYTIKTSYYVPLQVQVGKGKYQASPDPTDIQTYSYVNGGENLGLGATWSASRISHYEDADCVGSIEDGGGQADPGDNDMSCRYTAEYDKQILELTRISTKNAEQIESLAAEQKGSKAIVKILLDYLGIATSEHYQASRQNLATTAFLTFRSVAHRPGKCNSWIMKVHNFRFTTASSLPNSLDNFTYRKGENCLYVKMRDSAPFNVNGYTPEESLRVWNSLIKPLIIPEMLPQREVTIKDVKRNNGEIEFTETVRLANIKVFDIDGNPLFKKSFPKP